MTDLEAVTCLKAALAQMEVVQSGLYMNPAHRDAWWRLGTAIDELKNAIGKLEPQAIHDDVTRSIVAMASGGHIR